jgi:hypothetical protein
MDSYTYMSIVLLIVLLGVAVTMLIRGTRQRHTDHKPVYAPGTPMEHRHMRDEDLASLARRRDDTVGGES